MLCVLLLSLSLMKTTTKRQLSTRRAENWAEQFLWHDFQHVMLISLSCNESQRNTLFTWMRIALISTCDYNIPLSLPPEYPGPLVERFDVDYPRTWWPKPHLSSPSPWSFYQNHLPTLVVGCLAAWLPRERRSSNCCQVPISPLIRRHRQREHWSGSMRRAGNWRSKRSPFRGHFRLLAVTLFTWWESIGWACLDLSSRDTALKDLIGLSCAWRSSKPFDAVGKRLLLPNPRFVISCKDRRNMMTPEVLEQIREGVGNRDRDRQRETYREEEGAERDRDKETQRQRGLFVERAQNAHPSVNKFAALKSIRSVSFAGVFWQIIPFPQ